MTRRRVPGMAFVALFLLLAVGAEFGLSAFTSEPGAFPDEPTHLVTGLMVRDWVVSGELLHPLSFAERFYLRYPKVGLGQWPPVFYALQAPLLLLVGPPGAVLLVTLLTGVIAGVVFLFLRPETGTPAATLAGALFLAYPLVQELGGSVMAEVPVALFLLVATLAFSRFLDSGRRRDLAACAVFTTLAILTKGDGFAMLLVPPLSIVLVGRSDLLRRPAVWVAAALAAAACAPWYLKTVGMTSGTWAGGPAPGLAFAREAVPFYARAFLEMGGLAVAGLAAIGAVSRLLDPARRSRWAPVVALLVSGVVIHVVVPTGPELRFLLVAAAPTTMLAAAGAEAVGRRLPVPPAAGAGIVLAAAAVVFGFTTFRPVVKDWHLGGAAAKSLVSDPDLADAGLFICSDARGEGLFVAAVASREERPGHVVLRASKLLSESDWVGHEYRLKVEGTGALRSWLAKRRIAVLILDHSVPAHTIQPHHILLRELVAEKPGEWVEIGRHDAVRDGERFPGAVRVYRRADTPHPPPPEVPGEEILTRGL